MSEWVVVVPVKELGGAKTRLTHLSATARADLALAMADDVVEAALACEWVTSVVVVTNDVRAAEALSRPGVAVVADTSDAGLNPALLDGARYARGWHPRAGVAALSADLPCASPEALGEALAAAALHDRALVADASGQGTTLLTAGAGVALDPRYGRASRVAHVTAGVRLLDGDWPGLRLDVDTEADLAAATALGLGARTAAVLAAAEGR